MFSYCKYGGLRMKTSTLDRNRISTELVDLVSRLVDLIPWPERRRAMGDVTMVLLDGKYRVAEDVFGWGRSVVRSPEGCATSLHGGWNPCQSCRTALNS